MASVEQHSTENGIVWPKEISPYQVHIVPVNYKDDIQKGLALELYATLKENGVGVLLDDRYERAGVKFKDSDLIGIPLRIIVGKDAINGNVEFINRYKDEKSLVNKTDILDYI
jgi:prolyl-tRNA synthetase